MEMSNPLIRAAEFLHQKKVFASLHAYWKIRLCSRISLQGCLGNKLCPLAVEAPWSLPHKDHLKSLTWFLQHNSAPRSAVKNLLWENLYFRLSTLQKCLLWRVQELYIYIYMHSHLGFKNQSVLFPCSFLVYLLKTVFCQAILYFSLFSI